jgi:membrane protease YdiL (CAAX protease family)
MTEEQPSTPVELRPPLAPPPETFLERFGIPPVLFAFGTLIILFVLYQVIGGVATGLIFGFKPTEENIVGYRLGTGLSQIIFLFLPTLLLLRLISPRPAEFVRLRRPKVRTLLVPVVGIFSLQQMLQVYVVFQGRIPLPPELEQELESLRKLLDEAYRLFVTTNSLPELLWVAGIIAVIPAVAEELLFRGLVQRSLQKAMSPLRAVIVTGIVFGGYHLNPGSFVPLSLIGMYLGFLALKADTIWVAMTTHFVNNLITAVALYLHVTDDFVVIGNAEQMSSGMLLLTFWLFGVVFLVSTYYFLHLTKGDEVPAGDIGV